MGLFMAMRVAIIYCCKGIHAYSAISLTMTWTQFSSNTTALYVNVLPVFLFIITAVMIWNGGSPFHYKIRRPFFCMGAERCRRQ